jgi:hypothetical protein
MSQTTTHEIVPNADTIISLRKPCTEFADWGKPVPSSIAEIEAAKYKFSADKKKKKRKKPLSYSSSKSIVPIPISVELPKANNTRPENGQSGSINVCENHHSRRFTQSMFSWGSSGALEAATPAESGTENGTIDAFKDVAQELGPASTSMGESAEEWQIQFQVSAGVLMSASPWFNRILKKNGWMESNSNPEDRWFHISAEDWDEDAFVILMNIFHHRNHRVPRAITLEMLAKIAILVDYYECDESIQLFVDIWVADLEKKAHIPQTYCRDLILWMWISWVFRLPELFKLITNVAIKQSVEPVRNLELPIPSWITGMCYLKDLNQGVLIVCRRDRPQTMSSY